jgi:hypothetical protein
MSLRSLAILFAVLLGAVAANAQLSLITFLHNSPDPQLKVADLYVTQAGTTTKVANINFQMADNLNSVAIFGDLDVTFSVAPANSINESEALVTHTFTPAADKAYMAIVSGVASTTGYAANPDGRDIKLAISTFEVETSVSDPNKSGVYFVHGVSDLEVGDFWIRGGSKATFAGAKYGDRSPTVTAIDRKASTIDFTKANDKSKVLASFSADFAAMSSSVVVCVLSGFKSPADNSGSTDTMALLSVLDDGRVVRSPLLAGSQTSRVQVVHNAADPALASVDIYVNGTKAFDNVNFRRATPFSNLAANTPLVIGFAPATSTAYKDTLRTITLEPLRPGRTYTLVASGVLDSAKFRKNPTGRSTLLSISVLDGALEQSPETNTSAVRAGHFATDAGTVSITSSKNTFATDVNYGDAAPAYTIITPATDTLWVSDVNGKKIKGYVCDLRGVNKSFLVLASGFMIPDSNQSGPSFRLILVEANGTVNSSLVEVDPGTTSVDDLTEAASAWSVGPNPARDVLHISIPTMDLGSSEAITGELVSVNGTVVLSAPMTVHAGGAECTIPVTRFAAGAYSFRAVNASGTILGVKGLVIAR